MKKIDWKKRAESLAKDNIKLITDIVSLKIKNIELMKQLATNEVKICTPSMQEILNEAQRRKLKHSVQYADYSLETWTVASDLLEHRKNALLNDSSVRKVRIEYEM